MAYITISNSFTNGTTADATQVNTNFNDVANGLSDGTKDLNVNAIAGAGTCTVARAAITNTCTVGGNLAVAGYGVITGSATVSGTLNVAASANVAGAAFITGDCSIGGVAVVTGSATVSGTLNTVATAVIGGAALIAGSCTVADACTVTNTMVVSGNVEGAGFVTGTYFLPSADDTSAPGANYLYKANVPKAWAHMDVGAAGAVTITDDHNISSASWATSALTVVIDTNMANTTYAAMANISSTSNSTLACQTYDTTDIIIRKKDADLLSTDWSDGNDAEIVIMGDQ